jgi:transposase InsO family protein
MRSKKNSEISRVLMNTVFQQFNVKKLHSDNGPGFRDTSWLKELAALKIEVLHSSALHPAGRGQIERMVRTVKEMMRKMLATRKDLDWESLPFIISKVLNNSICPKTGFSPSEMVLGKDGRDPLSWTLKA